MPKSTLHLPRGPREAAGTDPGPSPFLLLQSIRVSTGRGDPWEDPPGKGLRKGEASVVLGWGPDTREAQRLPFCGGRGRGEGEGQRGRQV